MAVTMHGQSLGMTVLASIDTFTTILLGILMVMLIGLILLTWRLARERRSTGATALRLSGIDPLTGIANRAAWDRELPREMARAERAGQSLHAAVLDIDHFRQFTEGFGSAAGETLLRETAQIWRGGVPDLDMVAHLEGDTFGIGLVGTTPAAAVQLVDALRARTPQSQRMSAGLAAWDGVERSDALERRCIAALAEAKQRLGNRTIVSPDPGVVPVAPASSAPAAVPSISSEPHSVAARAPSAYTEQASAHTGPRSAHTGPSVPAAVPSISAPVPSSSSAPALTRALMDSGVPPSPQQQPAAPMCATEGCARVDAVCCTYRDRRGNRCMMFFCPEHSMTVNAQVYCRRHAGVVQGLGPDVALDPLPVLDNRAPSLVNWVARDLDHEVRGLLAQYLRVGTEVKSGVVMSVLTHERKRAWRRDWDLISHVGVLLSVAVTVEELRPSVVLVTVGRRLVAEVVPPWIADRTERSDDDNVETRLAFYRGILEQIRPALVTQAQDVFDEQ